MKWFRPYENNADTGKRSFLSGFAVYKQMLAEGKNKAKQTAPSSFSATEGAAEDEDNQTLSLAKTTLSPIMAMEENE